MSNPLDDDGANDRKETAEAKAILDALELELGELNEMLKPAQQEVQIDEELARIEAELTELRLQADKLKKLKDQFRVSKFDVQRSIRRKEMQSQDAKRALDLALENEKLLAELKLKIDGFEALTQDAKWRETIMPHQLTGAHFLASARRAECADAMGIGKTRQAIAYLDMIQSRKCLVVCPGDVMSGWERELNLFAPQRAAIILGKKPFAKQKFDIDMWKPLPGEDPSTIDPQVYMLNYESWARSGKIIQELIGEQFDTVILDEAHEIKNPDTVAFKGLKTLIYAQNTCNHRDMLTMAEWADDDPYHYGQPVAEATYGPMCGALMLKGSGLCDNGHHEVPVYDGYYSYDKEAYAEQRSIKNVLCMSGTPILNNPVDIWTSLYFINKDLFPNYNSFIRDYTELSYSTGKVVWRPGGESRLAKKIRGFYIRRTQEDAGIVLPPQEVITHEIVFDSSLYPKQAKLIEKLRKSGQIEISEGRVSTPMQMLALITRMRQAICWPGGITLREPVVNWDGSYKYDNETGEILTELVPVGDEYRESIKLDKAVELVHELNANNRRVILFSQFKTVLNEMEQRLNRAHYLSPETVPMRTVTFHGDTPIAVRDAVKRNFDASYNEEPKWDNVLANFQTGGVGLNFTKASAVIVLDEEWNPGKNEQAYDRIHRMGQEHNTQIHIMRVDNSMDTWMANLIALKAEILGSFNAANVEQGDLKAQLAAMFDTPMGTTENDGGPDNGYEFDSNDDIYKDKDK